MSLVLHRNDPFYSRRWYRTRKEAGLCIRCGQAPADNGYVSCIACRQRRKERTCGVRGKWSAR